MNTIEQQAKECAERCAQSAADTIYMSRMPNIEKALATHFERIILDALRGVVRFELGQRGLLQSCGDCDPCIGGRPDQCAVGSFELPPCEHEWAVVGAAWENTYGPCTKCGQVKQ